ncbi:MAG: hypothetical protein PHQ22_10855 [Sulfuricurvum sp.]|nr:hypothetical protein [Sulfuricurvum sp.]
MLDDEQGKSTISLTNEEKETIIRFDQTQSKASVFTYNKKWQKHLEKRLGLKPIEENEFGGKEYEVEKRRIPMPRAPRVGRKFTEKQKIEARERLSKARKTRKLNKVKK